MCTLLAATDLQYVHDYVVINSLGDHSASNPAALVVITLRGPAD